MQIPVTDEKNTANSNLFVGLWRSFLKTFDYVVNNKYFDFTQNNLKSCYETNDNIDMNSKVLYE